MLPIQTGLADLTPAEVDQRQTLAHNRLRDDLTRAEEQVESNFKHFSREVSLLATRLDAVTAQASRPVDAMNLVMSTRAIVSLVGGTLVVALSIWNLSGKIDQQRKDAEAAARIQELQTKAFEVQIKALGDLAADAKATAADAKRQYELLRYDLKDILQGKK